MSHYAVEIDLTDANSSHSQVIDLAGGADRVLDVGCWTGEIGMILRERGAHVTGFEIDPEAAKIAAQRLDRVEVGNLDRAPLSEIFGQDRFDVIIFADVLEHVYDPVGVLKDAATLLSPDGRVVISIPNVTHGSLRLALAQGRWRTTDTGLLDHTHIRFFSRDGLYDLLRSAGLIAVDLRGNLAEPLATEVQIDPEGLPDGLAAWVRGEPDALVYQFQVAARVAGPSDDPDHRIDLVPAADPGSVIGAARDAELARWRAAMTDRDHLMGLEATAQTARRAQAREQAAVRRLTAENRRLTQKLAQQASALRSAAPAPAPTRGRLRSLAGRAKRRLGG